MLLKALEFDMSLLEYAILWIINAVLLMDTMMKPQTIFHATAHQLFQEKVVKTLRQGYILKTLAEVILGTGPHSWAIEDQWMHSPSRHVMGKCVLLLVKIICNNTFQTTKKMKLLEIICLTYALWGPSRVLSNTKNWSWRSADHSAESLRSFRPRCTSCRYLELALNLWRFPATMDSNEQHSFFEQKW